MTEPRSTTPQPGHTLPGTPRGADTRVLTEPRSRGVAVHRGAVLLLAAGLGLLFDAHGLAGWADTLPDGLAPLTAAAHWWDEWTGAVGLAAPWAWLHDLVHRLIAAPF